MKQCSKCGETKPFTEFYARKNRPTPYHSECKKCATQRTQNYNNANKEKLAVKKKIRYRLNKELLNQQSRKYHSENREKINSQRAQRHLTNKSHELEVSKKWRENNPEIIRLQAAKRRALKKLNGTYKISKKEVIKIYSSECLYCGSKDDIQMDHVIPLSRGGTHSIGNLVPACKKCNLSKNDKTITEWRKLERQRVAV